MLVRDHQFQQSARHFARGFQRFCHDVAILVFSRHVVAGLSLTPSVTMVRLASAGLVFTVESPVIDVAIQVVPPLYASRRTMGSSVVAGEGVFS